MKTREEISEYVKRLIEEVYALLDKPPLLEPEYYKALEEQLHNN